MLDIQSPRMTYEPIDDDARPVRGRAARPRLRPHLRQQPAPRAAVVARGRRRHLGPHRGRAARVHHDPGRRARTSPTSSSTSASWSAACTARSARSRWSSPRWAPGQVTAADISAPADLEILNPELEIANLEAGRAPRHDPDDLAAAAATSPAEQQQGPGHDHRRHPGRLQLLARAAGALRGEPGARRPAHRLRQAHPGDRDRRQRRPARRDVGGGRDAHRAARDLRRPRQPQDRWASRGRGAARRRRHARHHDRGARAGRPLVQLPQAGRASRRSATSSRRPRPSCRRSPTSARRASKRSRRTSPRTASTCAATRTAHPTRSTERAPPQPRTQAQPHLARTARRWAPTWRPPCSRTAASRPRPPRRGLARGIAEKAITLAKENTLHARRQAIALLRNKQVTYRLFDVIGPAFSDVQGGYTRVLKLGPRQGDAAPMVLLELSREVDLPPA